MQKLTDYSYSIPGEAEVKYVLDDEQLIYLQWGETVMVNWISIKSNQQVLISFV